MSDNTHQEAPLNYKLLYERSPLGYQSLDENGNFIIVNPAWCELLGYKPEEVIGKFFGDFMTAESRKKALENFPKFKKTGKICGIEFNMLCKDGSLVIVSFDGRVGHDEQGHFTQTHCILQDLTEKKKNIAIEESYANIFENSLNEIFIFDAETFKFIKVNRGACKNIGYSTEELKKLSPVDLKPDISTKQFLKMIEPLRSGTQEIIQFEGVHQRKDGSLYDVDIHLQLTTFLLKPAYVAIILDITEQKRLKKLEQENKAQLQEVLNTMLTMVATLSVDGSIRLINTPPLAILALTEKDVINKKLWASPWFAHNEQIQFIIKNDCLRAAEGETVSREIEISTLEGLLWIEFSVHPVFNDQGNVKSLVAEGRDISRSKLAEEHLIRSQKMEALSKIVGGIAHDYNNMLGVISGYAGLLKRKCQDVEGANNYISKIIQATERSKNLTTKMLNFSHPEGHLAESCNMNQVLKNFHDILSKSLTAVIDVSFDLTEDSWLAWVDKGELEDSILNMAINAKYAMPQGGSLKISTKNVRLSENEAKYLNLAPNDYIKLSIADTGVGVEESIKEKIFDPFFTTKGVAGNGLGLSQVFGFVDRAGGTINMYSQLGIGTQFSLYFPRYIEVAEDLSQDNVLKKSPQLSGNETILVVDDEPALCELARQILLEAGYKVLTASDGKEALNILPTQNIDLILSDVIMPNMDGYQMAQKAFSQYPKIKIQLTSGFSGVSHSILKNPALKENILYKPYDSHELLTRIRFLLDGFILPENNND